MRRRKALRNDKFKLEALEPRICPSDLNFGAVLVTTKDPLMFADQKLIELSSGTFALITVDNGRDHTRPSTFGPQGLTSLGAAIDEAAATPGVVGIGVTGKPFIFAVGADLSAIGVVSDPSAGAVR